MVIEVSVDESLFGVPGYPGSYAAIAENTFEG